MGPAGLTAVFGMGTGVAPQVWSPGNRPAAMSRAADRVGSIQCSSRGREGRGGVGQGRPGSDETRFLLSAATIADCDRSRCLAWDNPTVIDPGSPRSLGGEMCGGGSGWSSRSAVRTGRLRRSPVVHSRPIDLVVFQEPSHPYWCRKPRLEEGFALRCLQRLSFPDLATRRCPERDSRHTRGRSSPILSY